MRGGPPTTVTLTDDERQRLNTLARRSRSAPQLACRARIILACADGQATTRIARRLHVSATTVCKWRTRFLRDRIDGLADEARPELHVPAFAAASRTSRRIAEVLDTSDTNGLEHIAPRTSPSPASLRKRVPPMLLRLPLCPYGAADMP